MSAYTRASLITDTHRVMLEIRTVEAATNKERKEGIPEPSLSGCRFEVAAFPVALHIKAGDWVYWSINLPQKCCLN